jgi:hypothetical protein
MDNTMAQIVTTVYVKSHSQLTVVFNEVWHGCGGRYDEYCRLGCDTSEELLCVLLVNLMF